jgi:hypothetical protein
MDHIQELEGKSDDDVGVIWKLVRDIYRGVSEKVLSFMNLLKKDWVYEQTWVLLNRRKKIEALLNLSKMRQ